MIKWTWLWGSGQNSIVDNSIKPNIILDSCRNQYLRNQIEYKESLFHEIYIYIYISLICVCFLPFHFQRFSSRGPHTSLLNILEFHSTEVLIPFILFLFKFQMPNPICNESNLTSHECEFTLNRPTALFCGIIYSLASFCLCCAFKDKVGRKGGSS